MGVSEGLLAGLGIVIGLLIFFSGLFAGIAIENRRYAAQLRSLQTDYRILKEEQDNFHRQMWEAMNARKTFTKRDDSGGG